MFLALLASLHGQHSSNSTDVAYEEEGDAALAMYPNRAIPVEQSNVGAVMAINIGL